MNVPVVSHLKLLVNLYNKMNNRFLVLLVIYLIIYLLSVLYKNKQIFCAILLSLLSWERGLKFCTVGSIQVHLLVAPLVGAWIEILAAILIVKFIRSLLSWERGLKFVCCWFGWLSILSLLSWERGLKSYEPLASLSQVVSLLSWERGLKLLCIIGIIGCVGRSSRGSVD